MNIYLAGPLFTAAQLAVTRRVRSVLEDWGHHVFDPVAVSEPIWKGRKPSECTANERHEVLQENMNGIRMAELVVAWLRGTGGPFTDQGVVWELGYAKGWGRPTLGFVTGDDLPVGPANVMIEASLTAACLESELRQALTVCAEAGEVDLRRAFPASRILAPEGTS